MKILDNFNEIMTAHYTVIDSTNNGVVGCCSGKNSKKATLAKESSYRVRRTLKSTCPYCNPEQDTWLNAFLEIIRDLYLALVDLLVIGAVIFILFVVGYVGILCVLEIGQSLGLS